MRTTFIEQGRLGIWGQKPMASALSQHPPLEKPCDQALLGGEGKASVPLGPERVPAFVGSSSSRSRNVPSAYL